MDKFLTFEGQQPIYLGDINFMQDAVKDAFKAVIDSMRYKSSFGPMILAGVENNYGQYSPGIVYIDGEILPFSHKEVWDSSKGEPRITIRSTYSGQRTTKTGTSIECYEHREAVLTASGGTPLSDFYRYFRKTNIVKDAVEARLVKNGDITIFSGSIWSEDTDTSTTGRWNLVCSQRLDGHWGIGNRPGCAYTMGDDYNELPIKVEVEYEDDNATVLKVYQWGRRKDMAYYFTMVF